MLQNATLQQQLRLLKVQDSTRDAQQMQQNTENATNAVLQKLSLKDKKKSVPLTDHTNAVPSTHVTSSNV